MRLVLLRHGRTEWNDAGRFQGHANPALDEVGRAQAAAVGPVIAAMCPDLVVSSDLARCRSTAACIGLPYRSDSRLREIDLGAWSGLTAGEAASLFPEEDAAWRRGEDVRRGGGETYVEVAARASLVLDEIVAAGLPAGEDSVVVFVVHGGTARSLVGHLLGLPPETWWCFGPLRNCHWTTLRSEHGRFRITEHNVGLPRAGRVGSGPAHRAAGSFLPGQTARPGDEDAAAPDTDPVDSPTRS